jgi:hypothetical protein
MSERKKDEFHQVISALADGIDWIKRTQQDFRLEDDGTLEELEKAFEFMK